MNGLIQPRLLSKTSLSLDEEDYHAVFHKKEHNVAHFLHYHDYYEIVFYLGDSSVTYLTGGKKYQVYRGDIIVCNLFEPHFLLCEKNNTYERFSIGLDLRLLLYYSSNEANLLQIFNSNRESYPILHTNFFDFYKYMDLIMKFMNLNMKHGRKIGEKAIIHQLLAYLYNDCIKETELQNINSKHVEIIAQLVRYIECHLEENLSLEKLAQEANYSVAHISRIFKEVTNKTLIHYIIEKRLIKAKHLLNGSLPIIEIAKQVGFNNYSYFYKVFKKNTGISPEKYRKEKNNI